ncbi:efflux RND transporter periplasmic adaptor subunit [Cupriavidus pauculus]|uniref:efflux RND transporter periplasmic adaptor subunit n=1 Tax=Cupriavidus pauculus TaxID=82633 RepID=UPI000B23B5F3|nr:efflux RND transporter periplasmic adaptor subunit [Cupriavidus pauculus]
MGGVITKRNVQVGHLINAGVALMSVVPLDHLWVTANLKESQLRNVRAGQPVSLTTDIYGRQIVFHGEGHRPGSGNR